MCIEIDNIESEVYTEIQKIKNYYGYYVQNDLENRWNGNRGRARETVVDM